MASGEMGSKPGLMAPCGRSGQGRIWAARVARARNRLVSVSVSVGMGMGVSERVSGGGASGEGEDG
jgi:hypothetical protein